MEIPGLGNLETLQKEIQKMLGDVNKEYKNKVDDAIKLAITPETQKGIKVNNVDCVAQMFQDNVRIMFPTKEMTKAYYDGIESPSKADEMGKANEILLKKYIELCEYATGPWYKRLRKWESK